MTNEVHKQVREQGVAVIDVTDTKEGRTQGGRVDMNEVRGGTEWKEVKEVWVEGNQV